MNSHLIFAIIAATLGSTFQHGYNTSVANAPQNILEEFISEAYSTVYGEKPSIGKVKLIFSTIVSVFNIGGLLGGISTAIVADRLGRKGGLLLNNVLVFVAAVMMGCAKLVNSFELLIAGRFVIGVNAGINTGLTSMYLTEISPVHLRGAIGSSYSLLILAFAFVGQVLGLKQIFGTAERWPILFAIIAVPAVFMVSTLPLCPESPKFTLMNRDNPEAAEEALKWLRGTQEVSTEMELIKKECEKEKNLVKATMREMLTNKALLRPLIISMVMIFARQFSGINALYYYSTDIFTKAGLSKDTAVYGTLGMGLVSILVSVIGMALMERAGRRILLLTGLIGMAVMTILLTLCITLQTKVTWMPGASIACVFIFMTFFSIGPGPIPFFLVNELFHQHARPLASSSTVATYWLSNFFIGICFLPIAEEIGGYTFLIFSVLMILSSIYAYFEVPETMGKTIIEITEYFTRLANGAKATPSRIEDNVSDSETVEKDAKSTKATGEE